MKKNMQRLGRENGKERRKGWSAFNFSVCIGGDGNGFGEGLRRTLAS